MISLLYVFIGNKVWELKNFLKIRLFPLILLISNKNATKIMQNSSKNNSKHLTTKDYFAFRRKNRTKPTFIVNLFFSKQSNQSIEPSNSCLIFGAAFNFAKSIQRTLK